jgi:hypothetical protein
MKVLVSVFFMASVVYLAAIAGYSGAAVVLNRHVEN